MLLALNITLNCLTVCIKSDFFKDFQQSVSYIYLVIFFYQFIH